MTKYLRLVGFSAVLVALIAIMGIWFVFNRVYPNIFTITLLFILIFIACTAIAIPISIFLNQRFAKKNWYLLDRHRIYRHGVESGLLSVLLAYIELEQTLDWTITLVLVGVFMLMEIFFLAGTNNSES